MTVFSEFKKIMPEESCVYFGDTQNMPYGEKTKDELIDFSKKAFSFFETQKVKAVVMACNTTSATVYESLKDNYSFKLYPIIQSVTKIIAGLPVEKIGVFATPATINSHAYAEGIKKYNKGKQIVELACPEWVRIVENKEENTPEAIEKIKSKLDEMLLCNPDKIILGCTHYPFLLKQLSAMCDESKFINPAVAFAQFIKEDLIARNMHTDFSGKGQDIFYASAAVDKFIAAGSLFYDLSYSKVELIRL